MSPGLPAKKIKRGPGTTTENNSRCELRSYIPQNGQKKQPSLTGPPRKKGKASAKINRNGPPGQFGSQRVTQFTTGDTDSEEYEERYMVARPKSKTG